MRRPRFFASISPNEVVFLEGEEHNHLARALRGKVGREVEVFDGEGRSARCVVEDVGRRQSRLRIQERTEAPLAPQPRVTCLVATPKGKRAQRLVEALTELGVHTLRPLVSARSSGAPFSAQRAERWSLEACKQCRRDRLPRCEEALPLAELAERAGDALVVFGDTLDAPPLARALPADPPPEVWVVVGPEGGFTPEERQLLLAFATPVSLGPTILRIETAACALLAGLHTLWPGEPS